MSLWEHHMDWCENHMNSSALTQQPKRYFQNLHCPPPLPPPRSEVFALDAKRQAEKSITKASQDPQSEVEEPSRSPEVSQDPKKPTPVHKAKAQRKNGESEDCEWHEILLESCSSLRSLRVLRTHLVDEYYVDDDAFSCLTRHPSLEVLHLAGHSSRNASRTLKVVASIFKLQSLRLAFTIRSKKEAQLYAETVQNLQDLVYIGPIENVITQMYAEEAWDEAEVDGEEAGVGSCRHGILLPSPLHGISMACILSYMSVVLHRCVHQFAKLLPHERKILRMLVLPPSSLAMILAPLASKGSTDDASCCMRNLVVAFPSNDQLCNAGFACRYNPDNLVASEEDRSFTSHPSSAIDNYVCTLGLV
eukprot:12431506-Karenia_brevis.AAC.3